MLFYTQLKREFTQTRWRAGQLSFRQGRVGDVLLKGAQVRGKIHSEDRQATFETAITIGRGTVLRAECSCGGVRPAAAQGARYCEHVAALSIFVVERGSLLRAGVGDREDGIAEVKEQPDLPEPIRSEPILFVRGLFQNGVFTALYLEAAIRYPDPNDHDQPKVVPMSRLVKQLEFRTWRTTDNLYLKLFSDEIPIVGTVHSSHLVYQGQAAIENLARLLDSPNRKQIVFHENVDLTLDPEPLKLTSLKILRKVDKSRVLAYEFKNDHLKLGSEDLAELSRMGRLSSHHAWKDRTLYKFETSLLSLARYTNRSGVAAQETPSAALEMDGYGYLYDGQEQPLHPLAAYRLSLELGVENFEVDEDWAEFHEWRKVFERKKIPALPKADYGFDLRDYQRNGLSWLWSLYQRGLAALLADDMGLGKTHQVLALLSTIYRGKGKPKRPSLVIAPTSVVSAWAQKLHKYDTGLKWHVFHGKGRHLPKTHVDLVLTTYGILQRDPQLREREWHIVVLDEAQAIKNATTLSARSSRAIPCEFRIAMTGTPVENQSTDLWSTLEFLLPGYLGSLPRFKRLYGSDRGGMLQEQAEALKRLVSPFLLRRTKSQVLKELPEKTEEIIPCEMTSAQRKAYRAVLTSAEAEKAREDLAEGKKVNYANVLAVLTRLKQICDHPRLAEITGGRAKVKKVDPLESGKWEALEELLHEALGSNLKTVVFTQYLGMMDLVGNALKEKGVGYTELRGDTPDRAARLEKFAADPECKVFVCSLLAGGLGIDLTSASVCIHLDRWWNPAKENQATDRLHRIGQSRGVQVFKLQIPGTVEDRIAQIIESKVALSDALIQESAVGLKAFSREELLDLLRPE
jgi:SNF2 family DNA or RNA helicase